MASFTIDIQAPELIDALNNLARAQTAAAEALNRLASGRSPVDSGGYTGGHPALPPFSPDLQPSFPRPVPAAAAPVFELPREVTPLPRFPVPTAGTEFPASSVASSGPAKSEKKSETNAQPEHGLTLDDLAREAAHLMGAGKYMLLVDLLGKFGVQALFQLPREHFGAFAAALRQLGAQI